MAKNSYELADWQGYLTRAEVDALKKLANLVLKEFDHNPLWIVNIGSGGGTSTIAMLEEADRIRVVSVDIQATGAEYATNEHLRLDELGLKDRVLRIWGDSKRVGKIWSVAWKVPMVFVDGDHTEPGIRGDIEAWLKHVLPGGVIAFHDYESKFWGDVKKVVDETMQNYEKLLHVDTTIAFRV